MSWNEAKDMDSEVNHHGEWKKPGKLHMSFPKAHEGYLFKRGFNSPKTYQKRYFLLMYGVILYFRSEFEAISFKELVFNGVSNHAREPYVRFRKALPHKARGYIKLAGSKTSRQTSVSMCPKENELSFKISHGGRKFWLKASTREEAQAWLDKISEACRSESNISAPQESPIVQESNDTHISPNSNTENDKQWEDQDEILRKQIASLKHKLNFETSTMVETLDSFLKEI